MAVPVRGQFLNHHLTDLSLASRAGEESEVDEQGVGEWKPGQVRQELSGLERSLSITTNTWASTWSSKSHPTHLLAVFLSDRRLSTPPINGSSWRYVSGST